MFDEKNKCAPLASSGAHFSQFSAFFGLEFLTITSQKLITSLWEL